MACVATILGDVERDLLDVRDIVTEGQNFRKIETVWTLRNDGREVKRDCHVIILNTPAIGGEQATM